MVQILLAGDNFITTEVLTDALSRHIPDVELAAHQSGFPEEPFRPVGGVTEATGDEDSLIAALAGCTACITHTHPFTRKVFESAPELKLVTVCRGGPVNVDMAAATEHGVTVTYVPGRNAIATAEHTMAMILAAVRQVAQRHHELVGGTWGIDNYRYDRAGAELDGSTLGVVGYGAIGSRVARACQALGMRVAVFDPYVAGDLPASVERVDSLDTLLAASAVVTLHARLTPETTGMIGRRELALMPEGSVLVNCARGGLLDYDALCDALDSGHLFAAACDVFPTEPLPAGDRLLRTPRLTLTPHVAGASKQSAHFAANVGGADIARFLRGERPLHVANP
jgi:D-3-phosphoglycerate dehydrogenase / 2-oxoglutarate reductase